MAESNPLAKKVVNLLAQDPNNPDNAKQCTGTPIAHNIILTAAHCVDGVQKNKIIVSFSTSVMCSSGFDAKKSSAISTDYIVHSGYARSTTEKVVDDVALVKINGSIPGDYQISSLYDGYSKLSSDVVTLIGYGITSDSVKTGSGTLRMTKKSYKKDVYFDKQESDRLVIEQSRTGICDGDSGGPVFYEVGGQLQIAGVNSHCGWKKIFSMSRNLRTYVHALLS